jgi:CO/xanthine dehydrogenase Mo-binding subunit
LAIKAKRPVMIVLDKAEETISTTIRAGAKMYIKTGVKKDGTIVARTGKVFYDAGGYSGFGVQAGGRCTNMLGGWYLMPNCHIEGYTVYTNKQVCGPVRGPGGRKPHSPSSRTWIPSPPSSAWIRRNSD